MRGLARGVFLLTMAVVAGTITLAIVNRASIRTPDEAGLINVVLPIGFGMLGLLTTAREPRNALGWTSLAIAAAMAISGLTGQYTRTALVTAPEAPFSPWIPLTGQLAEIAVYPAGLASLAFLLTPNGRFLEPGWRWLAWAGAAVTALLLVFTATELGVGEPSVPNPAGILEIARISSGPLGVGAFVAALLILVGAGTSVLVRLRRATGDERLQLRWVAAGTAFAIGLNVVVTLVAIAFFAHEASEAVITLATVLGFGIVVPASFAVAILRYRLYDLDLLLNRTVLYGVVTVLLAAALFGANLLVAEAVERAFGVPPGVVAGALGVAAGIAFGPLRRAARPLIDRALPPRSRLTLLFADIVESTQAIVDLGDERWREVLGDFRGIVRREIAAHRGREVNTAGDAFFAIFHRPTDGVAAARAIRDAVGELGLRLRIGLHVGDVETRGEQVSGLAVHAAARVMGLAEAGQVLVTQDVADALDDAAILRDGGARELRGVPGAWRLYALRAEPAPR